MIVLMRPDEIVSNGLVEGDLVELETDTDGRDDRRRRVAGLKIVPYDLPRGTLAGYFPECNPLVPLWYHDKLSKTPAAKGIPVRIVQTPT